MSSNNSHPSESTRIHSKLFYHGTDIEVCLGDRVRVKRLFRPNMDGTVCYIPGLSPRHKDLEYEDVKKWAIRLIDGTVLAAGYYPDEGQPKKHITFVGRSNEGGLSPDTILDDTKEDGMSS